MEEIELADEVGLDVFGVGEHHRPDFAVSAPAVVLAAAAARTERIRLTSAVTVLSSDDPVRVFQEFATLDLLSRRARGDHGRARIVHRVVPALRLRPGTTTTSCSPRSSSCCSRCATPSASPGAGATAPDIDDRGVYPRPEQDPLPVWIAVGGTPASVVRAGALGLPLAIAIIGGTPARFAPARRALSRGGPRGRARGRHPDRDQLHGYVADTSTRAAAEFYPPYAHVMTQIGRERGWPPMTEEQYEVMRSPRGALAVGDPDEVAEKILSIHRVFGNRRFLMQMSVGTMPHDAVMRSIELFGTEVAPVVRAEVARREAAAPAGAGG